MSRGLGALQRRIKAMLTRAYALGAPLRFADIRAAALADQQRDAALFGGDVTDKLRPTRERALKRALRASSTEVTC